MLDVRLPIGWLFMVLGVMLAIYGYANPPAENMLLGQVLLPLNLDVPWGILMALFGLSMVSLAQIDKLKTLELELAASKAEAATETVSDTEASAKG